MSSSSFQVWWVVAFIVLIGFAVIVGRKTGLRGLGILVDNRGRCSLTHFQVVLWTLVILSSLIGAFVAQGFDAAAVQLSPELLGLMGISAGSAVLATGVKAAKDVDPAATVSRHTLAPPSTAKQGDPQSKADRPQFAEVWLQEEGGLPGKVVDVTKFQNFILTLVVVGFYVVAAWRQGGIPTLPEQMVWLIGISHAGYVGAKIPNKK